MMQIKTITCHDVYNLGASLQAYALAAYLKDCKHDVQIIDYKPDYLSYHYSLTWVPNPKFDHPFIRQAYLLAKLPGRLKAKRSLRKKRFDAFRNEYLSLTAQRYSSIEALQRNCPEADAYIAGSDQIWNPIFQNGKDPAFFLEFAPNNKKKISYAASFSVDDLDKMDTERILPWLKRMDAISVRETSGVTLLDRMGLDGVQVVDPVFLLKKEQWEDIAICPDMKGYILVYDFDNSSLVHSIASTLANKTGKKIVSVFPMDIADQVWSDIGPQEFLGAILNADCVISNSFHATAFSLIFQKDFYVVNRKENINTRMRDLLGSLSLSDRLISKLPEDKDPLDWDAVQEKLDAQISVSKIFLRDQIT